jgi:hypothetical protein
LLSMIDMSHTDAKNSEWINRYFMVMVLSPVKERYTVKLSLHFLKILLFLGVL